MNPAAQSIVVLDFGGQYTQLIARRIRDARVFSVVLPPSSGEAEIRKWNPAGIILSGGPQSVYEPDAPRPAADPLAFGVPILGLCYGMQWLAQALGGEVANTGREYGRALARVAIDSPLFAGLEEEQTVWMNHGDSVQAPPPGARIIGSTSSNPVAGFEDRARGFYAVQFHPEVTHTRQGARLLERFVRELCGCDALWDAGHIAADAIAHIRDQVGPDRVLLALSGGVDSSVVAALLNRAIGRQLTCVFVDHGLLRLDEGDQVMATFVAHLGVEVIRVNAGERFLAALDGVADPELKRKIIGRVFIEVFEQEATRLADIRWLAQGTIYPDVIESAGGRTGKAHVIKSHHNVGGLPEKMNLKLLEPLRELFKDEVRRLGLELGLPREMVFRHPFPGPGLGVRILGPVTRAAAGLLRRADAIFIDELRRHDLYDAVSQAFAVFLPVRSVAVMGDGRKYDWVIALRAVETTDFMTARWARLPYDFLDHVSRRIVNEVAGVSRVVYDVSGKPPATIEWE